jgi:protein TonB
MLEPAPLGVKVATVLLSLFAHAAVALVAVHHGRADGSSKNGSARVVELPAPELEPVPAPLVASPQSAEQQPPARHTHPYPMPRSHDAVPHDPSLPHPRLATADRAPVAAAPAAIEAPTAAPPRFILDMGDQGHAPGGVTALGEGITSGSGFDEPVAEAAADSPARLLAGNPPDYTQAAEISGVEADVPLEIVVDARGAVVRARVLERAGYGLDEVALEGIRRYRFAPALRAGTPVAVRMRWLMRFRLR